MDETRHASSIPTTVLRDNREQRPWTSDGCAVETRDVTLSTGDYAVPIDCTHDSEADTYHPRFTVEHKSGHDFLTALTWDRNRFTSELRRGPVATASCGRRGVLANPPSQPGLYEAAGLRSHAHQGGSRTPRRHREGPGGQDRLREPARPPRGRERFREALGDS